MKINSPGVPRSTRVAYFSMEVGLESRLPTYSGGLGVLAGDTLRAAADLEVPLAAVTLLHRRGYFTQSITRAGRQTERPVRWQPQKFLRRCAPRVAVTVAGRRMRLRAWRYDVRGVTGHVVPVYFLDADLPGNHPEDRRLTDALYGGDARYRLAQEVLLGIGGVRMLRALGHRRIECFHMNEGHAALLTLELVREAAGRKAIAARHLERVRQQCVFTTHTPVPAGHDRFDLKLAREVLGDHALFTNRALRRRLCPEGDLNLTRLALALSRYTNGVAVKHGEVSRRMFPGHRIDAITNGVHGATWAAPAMAKLFDRHAPGWRADNTLLRYLSQVPPREIERAHREAKRALLRRASRVTGRGWSERALTIGFARRFTAYKRADLVFTSLAQLARTASVARPLQLLFAGKAHPRDTQGKQLIESVIAAGSKLPRHVRVAFVPGYDMDWGRLLTSGVDVWLNTPEPPLEASGTSGMKAALNGVPSLSTLDGWWLEGWQEDVTGWAVAPAGGRRKFRSRAEEARALYRQLARIGRLYYDEPERFAEVRRNAVALNGSFFHTHRMMRDYLLRAYRLDIH